jgi:hypothetical protein
MTSVCRPAGPGSGQSGPEQTVSRAELRPRSASFIDGELLTQGKVLEGEVAVAADEEGEEPVARDSAASAHEPSQ